MVRENRAQEEKTKELAVQVINLNPKVQLILSAKSLDKFIEVCERNDPDNFKVYHEMIRAGIAGGKPKYFVKFDDLPEEKAKQAFEMREKLITEFSKNKQYKEMCEEVYMLIIAGSKNDKELDEMKMKTWFQSQVIKCKANDLVCTKFGYDENQIEEAFDKFKLAPQRKGEDDDKETKKDK